MKALLIIAACIFFDVFLPIQTHAVAGLTAIQVESVKQAFEVKGVGEGDSNVVDSKVLVGEAKAKFKALTKVKNCKAYGYCPESYEVSLAKIVVVVIKVTDEGGSYYFLYTAEGALIASASQGESGDLSWD